MNLFKKRLNHIFGLFIFGFGLNLQAADLNLKTEKAVQNNFMSTSFEMGSFKVDNDTVDGGGLKLDFSHHFDPPIQVDLSFFTAFNGATNQVSFSGLGASLYYDVFGTCCETITTTYLGSEKSIVEKTKVSNSLQVGIGIDQFYLNGSKSVYSSSGVNLGLAYKFNLFDYNFKAAARYSMLGSNKQKIQAFFLSLGIVFTL